MRHESGFQLSVGKALLMGCGALLLLAFLAGAGLIAFVAYAAQDIPDAAVTVETPLDVSVGETFDLVVSVSNHRARKILAVSDIDIAEDYIAGFVVVSVDPVPKSSSNTPFGLGLSHSFGTKIDPQGTQVFTFTLRALEPGIFAGDVDVCEGMRSVTNVARTVVSE